MTTKLVWRLSKLPTPSELHDLVEKKIITPEEAKQILFKEESETERDKTSLEEEIKFLRELVTKLSNNQTTRIIETIKEVEKPYIKWGWYQPYQYWCTISQGVYGTAISGTTINASATINGNDISGATGPNLSQAVTEFGTISATQGTLFTNINTF